MTVLVTGASGWIAQALCRYLTHNGYRVRGTSRQAVAQSVVHESVFDVGDIGPESDWRKALTGSEVVVHVAGRAHLAASGTKHEWQLHHRVNAQGTLNLARQAAACGIRRFIFVSTLKVHGHFTLPGRPARPDDKVVPKDAYGHAKWTAETGLRQIEQQTGMPVVIVRPPLVYGPGVSANFRTMLQAVARGFPLPLGALTDNRRSFVALDNLVSLLELCIRHPAARGQTLLVSDGEDLSTVELLTRISYAMGRPARLWRVPGHWLALGTSLMGRSDLALSLTGTMQADISQTRLLLDWLPPCSVDAALHDTALAFSASAV